MANANGLSAMGLVSSWKSGLAKVKNRVRAFGLRGGAVRQVGALAEPMESRQMLTAVPTWLNAYGSVDANPSSFSDNSIYDVVTDGSNNVYVAGTFRGTVDFDFGVGTKKLTSTYGLGDGYVAKYTADGALSWITQFAASGSVDEFSSSSGRALSVDSSGNLYVAGGFTNAMTVDFGSGAKVLTSTGQMDVFVAKLSTAGALSYIKQFEGAGSENIYEFVGSSDGGITLLGVSTGGVDLDVNGGTVNVAAPATGGVSFVAHYDTSMNYQWFVGTRGTGATGTSNFSSADMAAGTNTLVVATNTRGPGEIISTIGLVGNITAPATGMQSLIASLDMSLGTAAVNWGSSIVSTDVSSAGPVAVDKDGNVYVGLSVRGKADLDGGAGVVTLDTGTAFEPVIVSLGKTGAYRWSAATGVDGFGEIRDMVVRPDPANAGKSQLVSVGTFSGMMEFDPGQSLDGIRKSDNPSGFVWYLTTDGAYVDAGGIYANPNGVGSISTGNADVRTFALVNGADALVLGGVFSGKVDFDASTGTQFVDSISNGFAQDAFFGRFAHTGTPDLENDGTASVASISVTGLGVTIVDNDTTPGSADGTDFGTYTIGDTVVTRTFTVTNTGTATLTLGGFTRPGGYTLPDGLVATLAPGASDTFKLAFGPSTEGTFAGNISFTTNVTGFETFNFKITGMAVAPSGPEVLGPTFDDGIVLDQFAPFPLSPYATDKDAYNNINVLSTKFDAGGNLYVVGQFTGKVDVDPGAGVTEFVSGPSMSNFLARYDGAGALVWAKMIRTENPAGDGVAISSAMVAGFDNSGNVLLVGGFANKITFAEGTAGAVTLTAPDTLKANSYNGFMARYSASGELQFAKQVVSADATNNFINAVVSRDGTRLAVVGNLASGANADLDLGAGKVMVGGSTSPQGVVALYDTDGKYLTHVTSTTPVGATGVSQLRDVAFDASNNLYIAGSSLKTGALLDASGKQMLDLTYLPGESRSAGVVIKLSNSTSAPAVAWSAMYKPSSGGVSPNLEVDGKGNVYIAMAYVGTMDLDPGASTFNVSAGGVAGTLPVLVSLTSDGNFRWGTSSIFMSGISAAVYTNFNVGIYENPADGGDVQVLGIGDSGNYSSTGQVLNFDPAESDAGKINLNVGYTTSYVWRMSGTGEFLSVSGLYGEQTESYQPAVGVTAFGVNNATRTLALGGEISSSGRVDLDPSEGTAYVDSGGDLKTKGFVAVYDIKGPGITPVDGVEFHVTGNGVHIEINDTTPATGDGTNFGTVNQGAGVVTKTFLVSNIGKGTLTLGSVSLPAGFTLTEGLSTTIAAGKTDTFKVTMDTSVAGKFSGDIAFETNMPGQGLFKFAVAGTVQAVTAPGVAVTFGATGVADGDASPSAGEGTLFTSAKLGSTGGTSTFTITNNGSANLTIGAITVPSGFVLVDGFTGTIAAGKSETIVVGLKTTTAGSFAGDVSIVTNVTGKNPYNFKVQGAVTADAVFADLVVSSKEGELTNGMGVFAGTHFGNATFVGSSPSVLVFTVTNTGLATMKTSGLTLPAGVKIVDPLLASIAPGKSDTFSIAMNTTKAQTVTGSVSFKTNVPGDETFTFAVAGTVQAHKAAGGTFTLDSKSLAADKTFYDEKGNKVVFALTGAGQIKVDQSVSGQLLSLTTLGTDAKSAITVTVTKDAKVGTSTGITTIGSIDIEGGLASFTGGSVNLTGGLNADGAIKALTLNDLVGGSQQNVKIGGTAANQTTLTFGRLQDVSVSTTANVSAFKALDWQDSVGSARDFLAAGALGTVTISGRAENKVTLAGKLNGDLFADIDLPTLAAGTKAPGVSISVAGSTKGDWDLGGFTLTSATVKGNVTESKWSSFSGFGSVTVGGFTTALTLETHGNLTSFKAVSVSGTNVKADGTIGSLTAMEWHNGSIFAGAIGKLTTTGQTATKTLPWVAGDFSGSLIVVGVSTSATSKTVGSISIKGSAMGNDFDVPADWQFTGAVGSISIGGNMTKLEMTTRTKGDSKGNVGHVGSLSVGGTVFNSKLDVMGKVGAVTVGSTSFMWLNTTQDIASFTSKGEAQSVMIDSQGAIGAITTLNWFGGSIKADKVASITTKGQAATKALPTAIPGNFAGTVMVTGEGVAGTAQALGTVSIQGTMAGDWHVTGKMGAVTAGSTDGLSVDVNGELTSFTSKGIVSHTHLDATGAMGAVTAIAFNDMALAAGKLASLTSKGQTASKTLPAVAGDFIGTVIVSGAGVGSKAMALGSVTIAGTMQGSMWSINGNSGPVTVGAMVTSAFFVGVKLPAVVSALPSAKSQFMVVDTKTGTLATLAGFTVTGKAVAANADSFRNSSVVAGILTNVSLKLVDLTEQEVHGIVAGAKIGTFSRTTRLAKPNDVVKVSNKTSSGVYDSVDGSGYSLRIVV